jgi:hypothetical protein
MTEPSAKVILDSVSPAGHRLTTMEVTLHRFVLAEFNTHRIFSRNSASSRAIPVKKQLERVRSDPAIPLSWPTEQPGMQGGDEIPLQGPDGTYWSGPKAVWIEARDAATDYAEKLSRLGVHKSVTNRLLEPFMWHTVIVSATDFSNFFALRCNPMAQPEIRAAAEAMRDAYEQSEPKLLEPTLWHLPFIQPMDYRDSAMRHGENVDWEELKQVSAARCARVSYLTHDGVRDIEKDLELYDRLTSAVPAHASPLEHVATPCDHWPNGAVKHLGHKGNFTGWDQMRHEVGL